MTEIGPRAIAPLLVDFWCRLEQPEIGDAVAMLRRRLGSRAALIQRMWDFSLDAELGVDESLVYKWEKGRPRPRPGPRYRTLLGRVCLSEVQTMDPMDRREFLRRLAALAGPSLSLGLLGLDGVTSTALALQPAAAGLAPIDVIEADDVDPIDHLGRLRAVLVDSDNLLGPRHVIPTVERYLGIIQRMRERTVGADARALLNMKVRYAEFAGWLYQDAGELLTAQRWLDRALEWSHAVGDQEMATFILARKSQLAGDMRDPSSAVDLAAAAGNLARPGSRLQALAPTYAAHGYAMGERRADCLRSLDDAQALVARLDDDPESQWAHWLDPTYVEVQQARCLSILGEPGRAVSLFQQAIRDLPPSYRRDRGVYLAREALAHAGNRDPEQASAVGLRALAIAQETQSGRIMNELAQLDEKLAEWKTVTGAAHFRDHLHQICQPAERLW